MDIWKVDYKVDSQRQSDHFGQVTLDSTEH